MSTGRDPLQVLYVGHEPSVVGELSTMDGDPQFLVSMTADVEVAATHASRADVDCLVCDQRLLTAEWTAVRGLTERAPQAPVVVRTDGTGLTVPATYYDATVGDEGADELARVVREVVSEATADREGGPATLLDWVDEYVAHVDEDGTVRMVNATAAERLGVPRERIVGSTLDELLDPEAAAEILENGHGVLETGEGYEFRDEADGRHYHAMFEPVEEGLFEVVVRDVTAVERAERAFKQERAFLESVIDSLTEVFFVLDREFRLVRWNDQLSEVTGLGEDDLRGADVTAFVDEGDREVMGERFETILAGDAQTIEVDVLDADGSPTPFEFAGSLVRDEDGEPCYICGVGRDVSDRKATERELDEAIRELERSNAELEQFAYVASHDLKEPLRMISSYLQLLERRYGDELDEDGEEFVEFAVEGARRMQEMIDDLLEYSRAGRNEGEVEPVDLERVLEEVRRNLTVAIEETDATVQVGDLPTIDGDRSRLVELFQNLVGNAIKYSEDDPHVAVRATREGDRWQFAVEDEGVGIPEGRTDRVFDLFYREDVHESTGIGLALAKKIAEGHDGDIWVESTPGEGSTFYISLPITDS